MSIEGSGDAVAADRAPCSFNGDMAPTIARLLDVPLTNIDGKALDEILAEK